MVDTTIQGYFTPGPVSTGGIYKQRRGKLDGFIGTLDGIASVTNSIGYTVEEIADIRAAWAKGQQAADDTRLNREEREQDLLLNRLKVNRGDNVQIYYVIGAAALAALILLR